MLRLTPHRQLSDNPLFALEARHLRWGATAQPLLRYSRRWLSIIVPLMLVIWLVQTFTARPGRFRGANPGMDFALWALAASVLVTPALDFLCISSALNSINGEVSAGRWDLLRMTLLRPTQIVAAKHGAAQVRAWRVMTLLIALRVAAFLMFALNLFRPLLFGYGFRGGGFRPGFGVPFIGDSILALAAIGVFCLEPLWRVRALTALGVAISTRAEGRGAVALLAVVAAIAFWIGELLLIILLASIISTVSIPARLFAPAISTALTSSGLFSWFFLALVFSYLALVQAWSLGDAARQIAHAN